MPNVTSTHKTRNIFHKKETTYIMTDLIYVLTFLAAESLALFSSSSCNISGKLFSLLFMACQSSCIHVGGSPIAAASGVFPSCVHTCILAAADKQLESTGNGNCTRNYDLSPYQRSEGPGKVIMIIKINRACCENIRIMQHWQAPW